MTKNKTQNVFLNTLNILVKCLLWKTLLEKFKCTNIAPQTIIFSWWCHVPPWGHLRTTPNRHVAVGESTGCREFCRTLSLVFKTGVHEKRWFVCYYSIGASSHLIIRRSVFSLIGCSCQFFTFLITTWQRSPEPGAAAAAGSGKLMHRNTRCSARWREVTRRIGLKAETTFLWKMRDEHRDSLVCPGAWPILTRPHSVRAMRPGVVKIRQI